jgi:diketogulonate reductase-like aldo/keto reductase
VSYDDGVTLSDTWDKLREIVAIARIKPAVVQVESHPYLPEWELRDYSREQGIVLLAFAAVGHALEPNLLEEPVMQEIRDAITTEIRFNAERRDLTVRRVE